MNLLKYFLFFHFYLLFLPWIPQQQTRGHIPLQYPCFHQLQWSPLFLKLVKLSFKISLDIEHLTCSVFFFCKHIIFFIILHIYYQYMQNNLRYTFISLRKTTTLYLDILFCDLGASVHICAFFFLRRYMYLMLCCMLKINV